ncbi:MAG: serine/threonine protein kinase [Deltaproteobacteria bacterium]|nr:serine/threonine protein kinase [Deltaproteobacteria bacterium]MBW2535259.1 serine/threonine protein kinase [Deltaproteobacteria bacterium]
MKGCPKCQRLYDEDAGFCPIDGTGLESAVTMEVDADPEDPRIGATICDGRYHVRRRVADGGMGRVYQALDVRTMRNVAVKVLHPDVVRDEVALERFKREYSLSAELPHDHIVEVYDFQQTEDHSYALVMEYLEGEELRMLLKREKRLSVERIVRMLSQLAVALDEAHRRSFVHRDIKPDNIFLCGRPDGDLVKLFDFGSVRDNTEGAKKLTVLGTTIGSPFYMSPEQAQGLRELDHRADVWSVAAIAYECLTGKLPFHGKTGPQILLAILGHEPDPPSIAAAELAVPPTVDDVMADGLAKDQHTRIGSLGELADRFGEAYGLSDTHQEWLAVPEAELRQRIQQGLIRVRERVAATATPSAAARLAGASDPSPAFTEDDDFVMGVPQGPPLGLILGLAAAAAVVAGIVTFVLLW